MFLRVFVLLILCLAAISPASAVTRQLASISQSELKSACGKAGGTFSPSDGTNSYDCVKDNCDGKGGFCAVSCTSKGVCTGSTPSRGTQPNQTLIGILQDGDMVLHEPDQTPPASLSSQGQGGAAVSAAPAGSPGPGPLL